MLPTRKCNFHRDYDIKIFCTEETCQVHRLLCLKCTVTSNSSQIHKNHQLVLIDDFMKEFEKMRAENPHIMTPSESQESSQANSQADTLPYSNEQSSKSPSIDKETNRLMANYKTLQKLLNDSATSERVMELENEGTRAKESPAGKLRRAFSSSDSSKTSQTSISAFLKEKLLLPLTKQGSKSDSNGSILSAKSKSIHESEVSTVAQSKHMEPESVFSNPRLAETASKTISASTRPTEVLTTSGNKSTTPWQISQEPASLESKSQVEPKKSPAKKIVIGTSQMKTIVSKFETVRVVDLQEENPLESGNLGSSKRKTPVKGSSTTKSQKNSPQKGQASPINVKLETSAMDQLRDAIHKIEHVSLVGSAKTSVVKEERIGTVDKCDSAKKSPFIYASDVYKEEELQEEARCLFGDKSVIEQTDLQEELRKQVTGFKEFCIYTQKTNPKSFKSKELKELWKALPKKEQDQWNSIALRKRIELRDQLETQGSVDVKSTMLQEQSLKRTKTT